MVELLTIYLQSQFRKSDEFQELPTVNIILKGIVTRGDFLPFQLTSNDKIFYYFGRKWAVSFTIFLQNRKIQKFKVVSAHGMFLLQAEIVHENAERCGIFA